MSYCPHPQCQQPENAENDRFCGHCGASLLLGGRYRLGRLIGAGGFGRTFLGRDEYKPSHPLCAVKQFCPQDPSKKAADLFVQEAQRLEQLGHHAQIPQLYAHFTQDHQQYIVQEWVDGQNLAQVLAQQKPFTEEEVGRVLLNLLPVLRFIHEGQVIHRDIKPENIIRRMGDQQLVLVDFGAAKYATETALGRQGTVIGSAGYWAPEQSFGRATFASDLYSLGVTCLELLTGVAPLELYSVREGAWVWRKFLPQPINPALGRILDKLLARGVRDRYQSAQQVLEALSASNLQPKVSRPLWHCTDTLTAHTEGVQVVAFHPKGEVLVSGSGDRTINLWRKQDWWELETLLGHENTIQGLSFHPQGHYLASASPDKTVKLWDWQQRRLHKTLPRKGGFGGAVFTVAYSPDGHYLASGGGEPSVEIWQVRPFRKVTQFKVTGLFSHLAAIAWSPDSQLLAIASTSPRLYLWSVQQQQPLWTHKVICSALAFSPNGQILAMARSKSEGTGESHSTILLWEVRTGGRIKALVTGNSAVSSLAFHPQGHWLISGDEQGILRLWDVKRGLTLGSWRGHSGTVRSLAFHPQGRLFASGSEDKTVKIWQPFLQN
ncbi:serine/threonine-protein kinase [Spirulina subsalsa]|uniref:serine/threonine-protein kinase n=1 Tax=Spirulina subsalsa TaxID=54311 RepID=UPI00031B671F|nr:serine/threonine-protein kinase [Spirulina subsalsa]